MPDNGNGVPVEEGYGIYIDQIDEDPIHRGPIDTDPTEQFERPSYVLENLKWGGPTFGTTGGTITWAILGAGQSLPSNHPYTSAVNSVDPVFVASLRAAFNRWEQVGNFDFVESTNPSNANMIVVFDELSGRGANTIGLAQYSFSGTRLTRSYISFDLDRRYRTVDGAVYAAGTASGGELNLYTLALHEIGHSLGLGHEDDFATIMNSLSDRSLTDLTSDDIAGIRAIYGAPGSTPPTVDDYAATTATTGAVAVGGSVAGLIDSATDEDWFRITLQEGASYRINLRGTDSGGGTLLDPYLRLLNASGAFIIADDDAGTGTDSQIVFTAASTGTYYLAASGFEGQQGSYTLAVSTAPDDFAGSASTTGVVTTTAAVGSAVNGTIGAVADTDWFRMTLNAGTTYRFRLTNGTLQASHLHLRNAAGSWLTGDEDGIGNPEIVYTATTSGTYYLDARAAAPTGTGTYSVAADLVAADEFAGSTSTTGVVTTTATSGAPVGGVMTMGDTDWFRMTLTAGTSYRFRMTNGTLAASHLHLRNAAGSWLTGDEDGSGNPEILFTAPSSGTYYLDARGAAYTNTGTYTVAADMLPADDFAGSLSTTGVVTANATVGTPVNGVIGAMADTDWFRMTLNAGTTYRFLMTNGTLPSAHLHLRNAPGSWLTGDEDGIGNPEIIYTATTTGTYYLDARAATYQGTGTYSITADTSPTDDFTSTTATTGALSTTAAVGTPVNGVIGAVSDSDWFRVTLDAGASYRFRLTNGSLPVSHLHLRNAAGSWLTGDEDGNGNPEITYTATTTGTYYLDARAAGAGTGTYTIAADRISAQTQTVQAIDEAPVSETSGLTASALATLTAPPAIDLWDLPAEAFPSFPAPSTMPTPFTIPAAYDINSPEDEHRLANTARFDPLFQLQQRTAFDLLPLG